MNEQDFSSLSTLDKLQHKLWKVRVSAHEELIQLFKSTNDDSDFFLIEPHLKKIIIDTNVVAQESALSVILEYVRHYTLSYNTRDIVIPALVEKCFGAVKASTKQKATDIVLLYAEIDQPDRVIEFIIPGTTAKQPKVVVQTVITLRELVRQFGINSLDPKPLLKLLPKLFAHVDKNVRTETFQLTVEIYRWLGPSSTKSLNGLKPVQLKELDDAFKNLPKTKPVPERLKRVDQKAANITVEQSKTALREAAEIVDEIDPYDLANPVDITAKLHRNFDEMIVSKNWKERREALDSLLRQAQTPKIMNKEYHELMSALSLRINDSNVLLVGTTANCIEAIALGLKSDFAKYKAMVTPVMMEKLKERKPAILEQLSNGLHAVFSTVPLYDWLEDVTGFSVHKNPQVRSETLKLISRQLKEMGQMPNKTEIKSLAILFKGAMDDGDGSVREAAAEGLGTMQRLFGDKVMLVYIGSLDDIKMVKVKEFYEKADCSKLKKNEPSSTLAPIKRREQMKQRPANIVPPASKPMARLDQKNPLKRKSPSSTGVAAPKKQTLSSIPSVPPEEIKYSFSQQEAESRATEFIPNHLYENLQNSLWKTRLSAIESLCDHYSYLDPFFQPEIVVRCILKRENNFQVTGKTFYCIQILAGHEKFTNACAALCIPSMVEKLGDVKLKKPASECLAVFIEKFSQQFVLSQAYPVLTSIKSPKVLSDALLWIQECLTEFGVQSNMRVHDLVGFIKFALGNTNVTVRTHAVAVIGTVRQHIGPEIKSLIQGVSPALLTMIEAEFDKVSKLDSPQPKKKQKIVSVQEIVHDVMDIDDERPMSTFIENTTSPRVDISGQLNSLVIACGDPNWKIRKEGLDNVQVVLNSHPRIKPTLGVDFPDVLKERLNDSNKNLQIQAIEITGSLAVAMGKSFDRYLKTFLSSVVGVLSDNKTHVRVAGINTLEQIRKTCGLTEGLINSVSISLGNESPVLRKDLLCWLNKTISSNSGDQESSYWTSLVQPLFSCIQDRNADVRKEANCFLPLLVSIVGHDLVLSQVSELKVAEQQTLMPLLLPSESGTRKKTIPRATVLSPGKTADVTPNSMDILSRLVQHSSIEKAVQSSAVQSPKRLIQSPKRSVQSPKKLVRSEPVLNQENFMVRLTREINIRDAQKTIDALKQFDSVVTQNPQAVLIGLDALIHAIAGEIKSLYSIIESEQSNRLWKHLSRAIIVIFSHRELAQSVSREGLYELLQELTHRMLDEKMSAPEIFRVLNLATIKIIENGKLNSIISILLSTLSTCTSQLKATDSLTGSNVKYTELIMKCLWKLAKTIPGALSDGQLNPDELLYEINQFFIITPPAEWKRRETLKIPCGELPLRTAKVLLFDMVSTLEEFIFNHMSLIQDPRKSSIYPYINHMLDSCRKKKTTQSNTQ